MGSQAGAALFVLPPLIEEKLFLLVELLEQLQGPNGSLALLLQRFSFALHRRQGRSPLLDVLLQALELLDARWG